ncbi:nitroreductase/quinone reductase family protein [Nocardioides sp.]|uniref:nitroreductase/quinone reductase family protein n=1 Tax=Nocardioides sp. TaxID=35761 RepID=UPI00286E30C0|nr:nitroreductase/quinone reductase family protein [Nocardioides sp.]
MSRTARTRTRLGATSRGSEAPTAVPVGWVAGCATAEAVGMTAAALAARAADPLSGGVVGSSLALAFIVLGGLVEGTALGVIQAVLLGRVLPRLRRRRYAAVTVLVAGLGWAAASAPGALAGDSGGESPSLLLVLPGAAALGVLMGALLGAAQAWSLRGAVSHPWRWLTANAVAWAPAMAVIFLGATTPGASWPLQAVLGLAVLTGVIAGAVLGLVTSWFLPSLGGTSVTGRVVLWRLARPRPGRLADRVVGLEVRGRRTGRRYRFPVEYAVDGDALVVVPGHPQAKTWWRNLGSGTPVAVLRSGAWSPAEASVLRPADAGYETARATYLLGHRRLRLPDDQPVVRVVPSAAVGNGGERNDVVL